MNIHTPIGREKVTGAVKARVARLMTQFGQPDASIYLTHGIAGSDYTHYLAVTLAGIRDGVDAIKIRHEMECCFVGLGKLAAIEPIDVDEAGAIWITRFDRAPFDITPRNTAPRTFAVNLYAHLKVEVSR